MSTYGANRAPVTGAGVEAVGVGVGAGVCVRVGVGAGAVVAGAVGVGVGVGLTVAVGEAVAVGCSVGRPLGVGAGPPAEQDALLIRQLAGSPASPAAEVTKPTVTDRPAPAPGSSSRASR